MLTVKYVDRDGTEELQTCETVQFVPYNESVELSPGDSPGLYLDPKSEGVGKPSPVLSKRHYAIMHLASSRDVCSAHAFVMNANGATVARYNL